MLNYKITISKTAQKQIDKLPNKIAEPLLDAISDLGNDPRPQGYKKLKGREGYRIRKGNYRIIYDVFDNTLLVCIVAVGHRRNIYS